MNVIPETIPRPGLVELWLGGVFVGALDPTASRMAGLQLINAAPVAERLAGEAAMKAAGETGYQESEQ